MVQNQQTLPTKKNNRTWIIILIVVIVLCMCLVLVGILTGVLWKGSSIFKSKTIISIDWGDAMVLILPLDGQEQRLSAYIFNLEQTEIMLPAGRYYAELKLVDGTLMAFSPLIVADVQNGMGAAAFKQRVSQSINAEQAAQQVQDLVRFLVAIDNVRLTYFDLVSDGFQKPLFSSDVELTWDNAGRLLNTFNALGDPEIVNVAANAFLTRAEAAQTFQPSKPGLSAPRSGLIGNILSFFGIMADENEIARQQVLDMYAVIKTPEERQESIEALDERYVAGAESFDEFIDMVRSGEIKDMVRVRDDLMQFGPMQGIMQDLHPDSNRPGGEVIHRVGAEAVRHGAELNVEVIKTVLTSTFPGIEEGFDYADKVNEWAEFVQQVYTDPLQAAGDELTAQAVDAIKNRIKDQFQNLFPDMDEDDVDQLVDQVTGQVTETVTALVDVEDEFVYEKTQIVSVPSLTSEASYETPIPPAETETVEVTPTAEATNTGSGPEGPEDQLELPPDVDDVQSDPQKDENSDFTWDANGNCWNYIGPAFENYTWSCANQCFNYYNEDWLYDCSTDCSTYIGPYNDEWAWDCKTGCWQYIKPNYVYNCATKCLEYVGADTHLWWWDCSNACLEYIGPDIDGYTWSCKWHRWVADD